MRLATMILALILTGSGLAARPAAALPTCATGTGTPYTFRAGLADEFASPPEPTSRGAAFAAAFPRAAFKDFDDRTPNRFVGHTFTGLPAGIVRAELELRVLPHADVPDNDAVDIGLLPGGHFAATFHFAELEESGGTWDVNHNGPTTFTVALGSPYASLLAQMSAQHALDVLVEDDTAVDFMALRVWTCPPPVFSSGLPHQPLGQARIDQDTGGNILLSQIGSSGADGARIELGEASGWGFEVTDLDPASAPAGAFKQWVLRGTVNGVPDQPLWQERREIVDRPGGRVLQISFDASPLGVTKNEVDVYDHDRLIYSGVFPNGELYEIPAQAFSSNSTARWDNTCVRKPVGLPPKLILADGSAFTQYDRVVHFGVDPRKEVTFRTAVESTAANVPTSNLYDEVLMSFGLAHHALGAATLEAHGGALTVDHLGAAGSDGLAIDLGLGSGAKLAFAPLDPAGSSPDGAYLKADLSGSRNGTPNLPFGTLQATQRGDAASGRLEVTADFAALGAATHGFEVYRGGVRVATVAARTEVASAVGINTVVVWPLQIAVLPGSGFSLSWPAAVSIALPGGPTVDGDELRVLPEAPSFITIDNISGLALRAAGLSQLTLTDVRTSSCLPVVTRQPAPVSCAAGKPAVFSVEAESATPLTYRWRKDGVDLADGGRVAGSGTATLILSPTILAQAGSYDVVVASSCGSVVSAPAAYEPGVALRSLLLALVGNVHALVAPGKLTAQQGDGLGASLSKALAFLHDGHLAAAANRVDVFLARVNAFVRAGALTAAQGQALTTAATDLRSRFAC